MKPYERMFKTSIIMTSAIREEDLQLVGLSSKSDDQQCCSFYSMDSSENSVPVRKILNKRRSYAQYHLELGQSNFLLHNCSICGLKYVREDAEDEHVHKEFHENFSQELISRIGLMNKLSPRFQVMGTASSWFWMVEVVKIMEKELGSPDGWLLHKLCKVYLFISRQRIVGCLVVEPIRSAHRVISNSDNQKNSDVPIFSGRLDMVDEGTILYEKEAVPATCGIRAIWVLPSSRRKRIATMLLDGMRKSFCKGYVLESSQCAFSQPTSSGKALATRYCGTVSFLIYMTGTQKSLEL